MGAVVAIASLAIKLAVALVCKPSVSVKCLDRQVSDGLPDWARKGQDREVVFVFGGARLAWRGGQCDDCAVGQILSTGVASQKVQGAGRGPRTTRDAASQAVGGSQDLVVGDQDAGAKAASAIVDPANALPRVARAIDQLPVVFALDARLR